MKSWFDSQKTVKTHACLVNRNIAELNQLLAEGKKFELSESHEAAAEKYENAVKLAWVSLEYSTVFVNIFYLDPITLANSLPKYSNRLLTTGKCWLRWRVRGCKINSLKLPHLKIARNQTGPIAPPVDLDEEDEEEPEDEQEEQKMDNQSEQQNGEVDGGQNGKAEMEDEVNATKMEEEKEQRNGVDVKEGEELISHS